MSDTDQLQLMKQIRAEAELLRAVAREADVEVVTIVEATRRKRARARERLSRERDDSRSGKRARELGEDR
jgi:hypothetical protein